MQHHLADRHQREGILGPRFGCVKRVEVLFQLVGDIHQLHVKFVLRLAPVCDRIPEVPSEVVRVGPCQSCSFMTVK